MVEKKIKETVGKGLSPKAWGNNSTVLELKPTHKTVLPIPKINN